MSRITLESVRQACLDHKQLPDDLVQALENKFGGAYYGHGQLGHGIVTIFLATPRLCMSRSRSTVNVGDSSVTAAFLDLDEDGRPLSLDIYPMMHLAR